MLTPQILFSKIRRRVFAPLWKREVARDPEKIERFTLPDGSLFDYPLKSAIGFSLFAKSFEAGELSFLRRSLKSGDVMLDIGANGGFYTVIAARQVGPNGHIYAFEPGKREVEILRRNVALNNLSNVTVIECGLSNTTGTAQFAIAQDGALNSLAQTQHQAQKITGWDTISITTLDDFMREYKISRVDFIKMDVEGAEKLVFEGASEFFAVHHPPVMFEACESNSVGFDYTTRELLDQAKLINPHLYNFNLSGVLVEVKDYQPEFGGKIQNFVVAPKPLTL